MMGTKKDILTRGPLSNDRYIEEFDPRLVKRHLYELQHWDIFWMEIAKNYLACRLHALPILPGGGPGKAWKRGKWLRYNFINKLSTTKGLMLRAGFHDKDAVIIFENVNT
jgi:hypothetical protein